MQPRLNEVGRQILQSRSHSPLLRRQEVYPFWQPQESRAVEPQPGAFLSLTPVKTRRETESLQRDVKDLSAQVDRRNRDRRGRGLLGQMTTLVNILGNPQTQQRQATPSPDQLTPVLEYMQRQQESVFSLVRSMREPVLRSSPAAPNSHLAQSPEPPKKASKAQLVPIEQQYAQIKENPADFRRLLEELNFKDDGSERFVDGDPRYAYSPALSMEEKAKIMNKIKEEKKAREENEKRKGLRGKTMFRAIGWAVLFPIFAFSSAWTRKKRIKQYSLRNMTDSIRIYQEGAKFWVLKAIRAPLFSTTNDPDLDLNISSRPVKDTHDRSNNSTVLKIQVRVKGILHGLRDLTNRRDMPGPMRLFVEQLVSEGAFVPQAYLVGFENSRLERDTFAALRSQTQDRKEMLVCFFFLTRVLVRDVLLKMEVDGSVPHAANKTQL